jgi:hypothetical protein
MTPTAKNREPKDTAPKLDQDRVNRAVDESKKAEQESDPTRSHSRFRMKDGGELDVAGRQMPNHQMKEVSPPGAPLMRDVDVNGHIRPPRGPDGEGARRGQGGQTGSNLNILQFVAVHQNRAQSCLLTLFEIR